MTAHSPQSLVDPFFVTGGPGTLTEENNLETSETQTESLELDKLEVKPLKPKEPSVSTPVKTAERPATLDSDWKSRLQAALAPVKNRTFVLWALTGLLAGIAAFAFISSRASPPQPGAVNATGRIVYQVSSPIGLGHYIELRISTPFIDAEEKRDLMNKLKEVRHALPKATTVPEVTESIRKQDLDALKDYVGKVVREVTGIPAEKLDLEIQSLN